MTEIEIGRGKRGRRAYAFDDIAVVPSRRTRDPKEVSIAWQIDAYRFELPFLAAPMDSVVSPRTAIRIGELGGLGCSTSKGCGRVTRTRAAARGDRRAGRVRGDPADAGDLRRADQGGADRAAAEGGARLRCGDGCRALAAAYGAVLQGRGGRRVDIFVIRGTTVSAEHVSGAAEPLNLKQFIYELDVPVIVGGCATYTAALHLMRTGAAGCSSASAAARRTPRATCWASRCRWPRPSRTSPPPAVTTWTSPAAGTCT
ncbi:IMP dehydrogenase [Streptomyces sp. M19]